MPDYQSKVPQLLQDILRQANLSRNEICCKLETLIEASGGTTSPYNTPGHTILSGTNQTVTYAANTKHSVSFSVISGTVVVTIGGVPETYTSGINSTFKATSLLSSTITFTTPGSGTNVVAIQTMS